MDFSLKQIVSYRLKENFSISQDCKYYLMFANKFDYRWVARVSKYRDIVSVILRKFQETMIFRFITRKIRYKRNESGSIIDTPSHSRFLKSFSVSVSIEDGTFLKLRYFQKQFHSGTNLQNK